MKVYVAGPMTGYENYNKPAFFRAAAELRCQGHDVICPAENDSDAEGMAWTDFLRKDLVSLTKVEGIFFLPGWMHSQGARFEAFVGFMLGLHMFDYKTGRQVTKKEVAFTLMSWTLNMFQGVVKNEG